MVLLIHRVKQKGLQNNTMQMIVLWGEVYRGGTIVNFEINSESYIETSINELDFYVSNLTDFDIYVFNEMPDENLFVIEFIQGQINYFEKNYDDAIEFFEKSAARIPEERDNEIEASSLYFYMGYTYSRLQDNDKSLAAYSYSIALDPELAVAYNGRGLSISIK